VGRGDLVRGGDQVADSWGASFALICCGGLRLIWDCGVAWAFLGVVVVSGCAHHGCTTC